jgi:fibronectin-binding autotransporter adhesin
MRQRFFLRCGAAALLAGIMAGTSAWAQTAIWMGGGGDQNFSTPGNWTGGVVPPGTGGDLLEFSVTGFHQVTVDIPVNVTGIQVDGTGSPSFSFNAGIGTVTLGALGIFPNAVNSGPNLVFNVPVILGADQTWTTAAGTGSGSVTSTVGISGAQALTIGPGELDLFGTNTFSGGLTIESGALLSLGTGSIGTGTLTLEDNASVEAVAPVNVPNAVSIAGTTLNLDSNGNASNTLTFSGAITAASATPVFNLASTTAVVFSGPVNGPALTDYTIAGQVGTVGSMTLGDGGSQLVLKGSLNDATLLTVDNTSVILDPSTADPSASLGGIVLPPVIVMTQKAYLGLDGTYATFAGGTSEFFSLFGPLLGTTINGSIGFDTFASPGTPQTFHDPIDLTFFTSVGFLGLGSSTSAILAGTITPTLTNTFVFGGGGGRLTVTSNLNNVILPASLIMSNAPEPLTLILQGAANYTGSTISNGGVLIFDTASLPPGAISLNGGYVGYTEHAGVSPNGFIGLFSLAGNGVVGIDQATPASVITISNAIDMSGFHSGSSIFLGTSTNVDLGPSSSINPANHQYLLTGVKGGTLTVDTPLADVSGSTSLTIGLVNPIEINGGTSEVKLTGNNSFTAGTTFNSGSLFVNSGTAFGTGAIVAPDTANTPLSPYLASYGGSAVTLANNIQLASINPGPGASPGLSVGNNAPAAGDMLVLNGVISNFSGNPGLLSITGPVTLNGANSYTGGTEFDGNANTPELFVGNASALGTGPLNIDTTGTLAPNANLALANPIVLGGGQTLVLGQSLNPFTLTLNGIVSGSGGLSIVSAADLNGVNTYSGGTLITAANVAIGGPGALGTGPVDVEAGGILSFGFSTPTLEDLSGAALGTIALTGSQTLTLADNAQGGSYLGVISGSGTNAVVKTGTGLEDLSGVNTYGGGTTVNAGVLAVGSGSALGTGPVSVMTNGQLSVDSGVTFMQPITLSGAATLSGAGTFSPLAPLTFSGGAQVMAGIPNTNQWISTLHFGTNVTFGTGGAYTFNVANAAGTPGVDYSTIFIAGTLNINATALNKFSINLTSISPGTGDPGLANFNAATPYSWTILTASGGITGWNPAVFTTTSGNFQNSLAGGSLLLGQSGNSLVLDFTPVPEPSTWLMLGAGVAAVGLVAWRRRARLASL